MRHGFKKKFLCYGLTIIILIILLHPDRNARATYDSIKVDNILNNLNEDVGFNFTSTAIVECDYYDIIRDDTTLPISLLDGDLIEGHRIKDGGEYAPIDCRPKYSTAIILAYRNRAEQLRGFLVYMHMFLHKQQIHYRIYVVEQVDTKPFNRAKLMNIGAKAAIRDGYPCLILHDVDLLPIRPSNLYACTKLPRHMSCSIDKYRFALPRLNLFSGVMSISTKQFRMVNGFNNDHLGAKKENDDLFNRLQIHNIGISRFEPKTSSYYKINPEQQEKSEKISNNNNKNREELSKEQISTEGLNSVKFTEVATVLHPLFTHIMVDL